MSIRMAIAVAAGLSAVVGLTVGAGAEMAAPAKPAKPEIVRVAGCSYRGAPEYCVMIKGGKKMQVYNVTGATPPIPVGKSIALRGEVTNRFSPCGGIVLDKISWAPFPSKCPKPKGAK